MSRPLDAPVSGEAAVAVGDRVWVIGGLDAADGSTNGVFAMNPHSAALASIGTLPAASARRGGGRERELRAGAGRRIDGQHRRGGVGLAGRSGDRGRAPSEAALGPRRGNHGRPDLRPRRLRREHSRPERARDDGRQRVQERREPSRCPSAIPRSPSRATRSTSSVARLHPAGRPTPFRRSTRQPGPPGSWPTSPNPSRHASAVDLGGRIYVLGGTAGGSPTDRIVAFDPGTRALQAAGTLPSPVSNAAAATVGGSGYLIGGLGKGGTPLDSVVRLTLKSVHAPAPPLATSTTARRRPPQRARPAPPRQPRTDARLSGAAC